VKLSSGISTIDPQHQTLI